MASRPGWQRRLYSVMGMWACAALWSVHGQWTDGGHSGTHIHSRMHTRAHTRMVMEFSCIRTHARHPPVMTGTKSKYPMRDASIAVALPADLRPVSVGAGVGFTFPESMHPNLRFWFTPEALAELNAADGAGIR